MKFTDEQKDLLAFLPKALKNSNELTVSSKLVLGNIIFLYGMEDAQKNGYVFRSYDDLMKDTFIKSKTTISKAIALLVQKEYIKVKSGRLKDRKANEFTLLDGTLLNKMCTEKCTDKNEKCTLTDYWTNKIESLENEIVLLKKEIEELKKCTDKNEKCTEKCTDKNEKCTEKCTDKNEKCTEKCTDKNEKCTEKCTTESDLDIESDKEIDKDISTCSNSTCMEEKENNKEKENEMSDSGANEMNVKENGVKRNETTTSTQVIDTDGTCNNSKMDFDEDEFDQLFLDVNSRKANEMSDKQRSNNVAGCAKENEMITPLATAFNDGPDTPSNDNVNNNTKLLNDGSIFKEDCSKTLPNPNPFPPLNDEICKHNLKLEEAIFGGSGSQETTQVEQLPTKGNTTQQDARKCPQIEFDKERMDELFSLSERETNFGRFKEYVKQMDEYMQYLKANDPHRFKLYRKEIYCWFARNTWDMNFDFIEFGGNFKRKYVA